LFRLSQNFWIKFQPIHWLMFWPLDEKVTTMYWYQWRLCRIKITFFIYGFPRMTHSGDATVRVEHHVWNAGDEKIRSGTIRRRNYVCWKIHHKFRSKISGNFTFDSANCTMRLSHRLSIGRGRLLRMRSLNGLQ
jgi:hypothetical protein